MKLKMSIVGRIERNIQLGAGRFLLPLFEAVSNSFHAIEDGKRGNGHIKIEINRKVTEQGLDFRDQKLAPPIIGFKIEDNGVGFNRANFDSFCLADSLHKKARGGKGIGRLYWLKAFKKVHVKSCFQEDNEWFLREFDFQLADEAITNDSLKKVANGPHKTIVELIEFRQEYSKESSGFKQFETVARKILDHFLTFFLQPECPVITLSDTFLDQTDNLNRFFEEEMKLGDSVEKFEINSCKFSIQHLRLKTTSQKPNHSLYLCAHGRAVKEVALTDRLPVLSGPLTDEEKDCRFIYSGCLSGDYLDNTVNQDRSNFEILPLIDNQNIDIESITQHGADLSKNFLNPFLAPIKEKHSKRITDFAQQNPRYRPVVKLRPDWTMSIRGGLKDEELELEMFKLSQKLELEIRQEGITLTKFQENTFISIEERKNEFKKYLDESNALGIAKLAEYILHRRVILDFMADCMKLKNDGKYPLEDVVHDLIFPMKSTSDDITDPDKNNLWMVDERMAYHVYLSSDLEFSNVEPLEVSFEFERERMDLFVLKEFDVPHAFVGSERPDFSSVTIVELKRPMRDNYQEQDEEKDPIWQVWRYVERIREGKVKDRTGQFIRVKDSTPFFAFIICSLTPRMEKLAKTNQFTLTPDGNGYFNWHPNFKVYTEIISYDKLIKDARNRNQVLFDKLNLPYRPKT